MASGDSNVFKIVKLVMEQNMAPVIVFSFSKKDCEDYAKQMSKLYFTTSECFNFIYGEDYLGRGSCKPEGNIRI